MYAAGSGHGGVVGALLEHGGAELDARDVEGWTALMYAAASGQAAVAAQLVEAGADATLRATGDEWEGKTALEMAEAPAEKHSWESDEESDEEEPLELQSDDDDPVKRRQRAIARLKDGRGSSAAG